MTPLTMGMYFMIVAGFVGVAVAFMIFARMKPGDGLRRPIAASIIGVLLMGIGTFGPSFMDPYGRLLGGLIHTTGAASDVPKYQAFLDNVGAGKLDDKQADVGIAHVLSHPVAELDTMLVSAIKNSSSQSGRQRLQSALAALQTKNALANEAIEGATKPDGGVGPRPPRALDLSTYDPGVRLIIEHELLRKPAIETKAIELTPESAKRIDALRSAAASKS